jgi:hypothetical protein
MAYSLSFKKTSGPDLSQIPRRLVALLRQAIKITIDESIPDIRSVLPIDRGQLRDSVKSTISDREAKISMNAYVLPLEFGLPVGYRYDGSVLELAKWVIRQGMATGSDHALSIAYAIINKWRRQGRVSKGFLGLQVSGVIPSTAAFPEEIEVVPGSAVDRVFKRFERQIAQLEEEVFS